LVYKIIGADGREYGPVAAEQLRQWLLEGRVNSQTLLQPEGSTDWKALVNYQEVLPPVPPPVSQPTTLTATTRPGADKKISAGICGILLGSLGIHKFILGYTSEGVTMLLVTVLTCGIGGCVMHIIGLIEGILYLTKSDEEFVATYITSKKGWF
jgi:TM2 domain-containing membrane protein YozV